jgi:hypothetical protein
MVLKKVKEFFFGSKGSCSCESTCDESCKPQKKSAKKSRKRK